jgi:hypothetical protein
VPGGLYLDFIVVPENETLPREYTPSSTSTFRASTTTFISTF